MQQEKKLGRLATKISVILMGKDEPSFEKNIVSKVKVNVENISLLDISKKKMEKKIYQSYSGYPGGLKEKTMKQVVDKKGHGEILRKAVLGMLPKNKLQSERIKNLNIK